VHAIRIGRQIEIAENAAAGGSHFYAGDDLEVAAHRAKRLMGALQNAMPLSLPRILIGNHDDVSSLAFLFPAHRARRFLSAQGMQRFRPPRVMRKGVRQLMQARILRIGSAMIRGCRQCSAIGIYPLGKAGVGPSLT